MGAGLMNGKKREIDGDQEGLCTGCRLEEDRQLAEVQAAGGSDDDHGGYAYDDDSGGAAVPDEEVPDTQDVFGGGYTLRRQNAQRFQILWRLELVPYDWLLDYLNHLKRQMARIQQTQMRRQDRQRQHLHRQDQQR